MTCKSVKRSTFYLIIAAFSYVGVTVLESIDHNVNLERRRLSGPLNCLQLC